jgi:hypothetical protein
MKGGFDRRKSLQELEQHDWGEPNFGSSLVATCHRLRRKPLDQFTTEDLRIMIGQKIGLPFLIPLAVERMEVEPLAEGDFYPGDLLSAVLRAGTEFWSEHADSKQQIRQVAEQAYTRILDLVDDGESTLHDKLATEVERFLAFNE